MPQQRNSYHKKYPLRLPMSLSVCCTLFLLLALPTRTHGRLTKRSYSDESVHGYVAERICWWNEVCKEEFQSLFKCKCPQNAYCRSPGRYYNAYCSMTDTGYVWSQPHVDLPPV